MNFASPVYRLPLGFKVQFFYSHPAGLRTEWEPDVPHFDTPRARRRVFTAYQEVRGEFMREVATALGGAVMVVDTTGEVWVFKPLEKH